MEKFCKKCLSCEYNCYVCEDRVKAENYIDYLTERYEDNDEYLRSAMCERYPHVSCFGFWKIKCRFCVF